MSLLTHTWYVRWYSTAQYDDKAPQQVPQRLLWTSLTGQGDCPCYDHEDHDDEKSCPLERRTIVGNFLGLTKQQVIDTLYQFWPDAHIDILERSDKKSC